MRTITEEIARDIEKALTLGGALDGSAKRRCTPGTTWHPAHPLRRRSHRTKRPHGPSSSAIDEHKLRALDRADLLRLEAAILPQWPSSG